MQCMAGQTYGHSLHMLSNGWLAGQYEISLATLNAEDRLRLEMAADMCEFRHWKVSIYTNFFFSSNKVFYVFYMEISPFL